MRPPPIGAASLPKRAAKANTTRPAGTAGMACASGGAMGAAGDVIGAGGDPSGAAGDDASGAGLTMVAPGEPVPARSGIEAVDCGAIKLRVCAWAGMDTPSAAASKMPAAAANPAPPREAVTFHPDIAAFLDSN